MIERAIEIAERRFMEGLPGRFRSTTQPDLFRTGGFGLELCQAQLVLSRERKGVERIERSQIGRADCGRAEMRSM